MSRVRLIVAVIAVCAVAILAGLVMRSGLLGGSAPQAAAVGGPFRLVDQDGKPVDERLLKGRWSAVFFGFTYCPEACPVTLAALAGAEDLLGPAGKDLQTVFISVDPARDTPAQLKTYLSNPSYPRRLVGLTGTPAQVDAVAKAYHVFYETAGEGPGYLVNHSTMTYVMSPAGRFVCVLPYGLTPEQTAERLRKAMRGGAGAQAC